jgi:hypothetical protein
MSSPRAGRLALVGLTVVGLLAVVALASRGGLGGAGGGGEPPPALLDYGFTIFLVLYAIAIPFTIWAYLIQQRETRGGSGKRKRGGIVTNLLIFVVLFGAALGVIAIRHSRGPSPKLQVPSLTTGKAKPRKQGSEPREPRFQWSVLVVFAGVAAAGAAAYLVRRRALGGLREPTLAEQLRGAIDDAIDDVRAETDPRRAVIKAYARMEQILAAHGLPRRESEAPYEYLVRTLAAVDASGESVERMTALYERARFSLHEIDSPMRADAIDALTAVRDELREAV